MQSLSKVDKNEICQKIISKIKKYDKIICLRHIDADGDAYGSAMGLAQLIKDNFPEKKVFQNIPAYLRFTCAGVPEFPVHVRLAPNH